jgi:hypothetical protein
MDGDNNFRSEAAAMAGAVAEWRKRIRDKRTTECRKFSRLAQTLLSGNSHDEEAPSLIT